MQYSIVNKSRLHVNLRIDAEFYSPEFLKLEKTLNSHNTERFFTYSAFVKKGIFDLSPDFYRAQGVPLIRTSEIKDPQIDFSSTVFLDENTQNLNRKTELSPGDIVFTKIGAYIGDVAMLPQKYGRYNFSQNVTGVKLRKGINTPGFLLAYLLSKYGNGQIKRIIMLSGQGKLELEDVKNIRVVLLGEKLQQLAHMIVLQAETQKEKSINIYKDAEQVILSELGFLDWKPKHRLSFFKKFSDTNTAGRIDAEYFQPMYDDILDAVKKYGNGFDLVGNLFKQNRSGFKNKPDELYRYVEISSVNTSSGEIDPLLLLGNELPVNAKIKLNSGDLIISKVRTYRGAVAIVQNDRFVGSGAFTVLRESEKINKETAYVFFKSAPILRLSLKYNSGTSYPVIDDKDILNLPFPVMREKAQKDIKQKITEMYETKALSKRLLDIAKLGVEMAIEKSEKDAQNWIDAELKKLRIKL